MTKGDFWMPNRGHQFALNRSPVEFIFCVELVSSFSFENRVVGFLNCCRISLLFELFLVFECCWSRQSFHMILFVLESCCSRSSFPRLLVAFGSC